MNLETFRDLGVSKQLGDLNCKNGYSLMRDGSGMLNIPFSYLFPIIYYPEGEFIDNEILDIRIFGSMITPPKEVEYTTGFWKWKKKRTMKMYPRDIDIAVITHNYNSTYLKKQRR
jgi:hypothetical protein